ncbi:peptidoglycan endopeptidase [Heliobacillus mobilis]|uniref:Peptidoglycan endopeptidase n=2 Tax=Heliobacterium TaxID=2697 RepID=A0A6I3SP37_HELMO|nr:MULTISPECIES: C40 family peptidase [Heliobacterium]MBC9783788.1 C40 family peptidase [Heliobacterium chlorum]MTV50659.1 peptidoglycan endopeptidase [Heliobacterium mobile]
MFKRTFIASVLAISATVSALAGPALAATSTQTVSTASVNSQLPPGVKMDKTIKPLASLSASDQQKLNAVLKVAKSKLGTPYIWGHNEDRGQRGFDCSNFTAYVYHHALGYKMSTASRTQNTSVGWKVPKSQMRPGDLVIFDNGKHVGIYVGNDQVIQEGGGLGKVGYLSVASNAYWGKHITAVKRMY